MTVTESSSPSAANVPQACAVPRFLFVRLSVLIFLVFAVMGAWLPVFSLHLKNLQFSPEATAWASAASAIASLVAPLLWGQIADRWLAMQRCISLCAAATGVGLWLLADLSVPWLVIVVCIAMWLFLVPAVGLSTSLVFRQLDHPERQYGRIRMWGTIGWVAASWCLTLWLTIHGAFTEAPADLADSLRLGSLAAILLAGYALTLPDTPPKRGPAAGRSWLRQLADAPLQALHLFCDRSFLVFCTCIFGFNVTLPFSIQLNPLLLAELEIEAARLPTYLTIAQSTEVLLMYLLPILLMRFGVKSVMITGGISWTVGLSLLSVGAPVWLVLASLLTHGVFICCFLIGGQVYVNQQATHDIRASAQGLLLLVSGSGLLFGNLLVGWIRDWTGDRYSVAYLIAAVLAGGLVVLFWRGFSVKRSE